MWFLGVGVLLLLLKLADVAPVVEWSWWWVLSPFGLAAAWWAYADSTGITQKREMDKMDRRRDERRMRAFEALGVDPRTAGRHQKAEAYKRARQERAQATEAERTKQRKKNEETLARGSTQFGSEFDDPQNSDHRS